MLKFKFGENWLRFNKLINRKKILQARNSLKKYKISYMNKSFLDVGCGSGLFSLAASTLGCKKIYSVDVDDSSIKSTKILRENFNRKNLNWNIEKVSLIRDSFTKKCKNYDIIYCWGVAHHTGNMFKAFENLVNVCKINSHLVIAIYNDEGLKSKIWWIIKYLYNFVPSSLRKIYAYFIMNVVRNGYVIFRLFFTLQFSELSKYLDKKTKRPRGMNADVDIMDWVGGYPFEYIKFNLLKKYFISKGFKVIKSRECKGSGNHEIVFKRIKLI